MTIMTAYLNLTFTSSSNLENGYWPILVVNHTKHTYCLYDLDQAGL